MKNETLSHTTGTLLRTLRAHPAPHASVAMRGRSPAPDDPTVHDLASLIERLAAEVNAAEQAQWEAEERAAAAEFARVGTVEKFKGLVLGVLADAPSLDARDRKAVTDGVRRLAKEVLADHSERLARATGDLG